MSYNIKKLSEVEALPEVPEGANMIAEVGGQIKRVPAVTGEGGGTGVEETFDITFTSVEYEGIAYAQADKTVEEVGQAIKEGKRINAEMYTSYEMGESHQKLTPAIRLQRIQIDGEIIERYDVDFYSLQSAMTSNTVQKLGIKFIEFSAGLFKGPNRDRVYPIGAFAINDGSES